MNPYSYVTIRTSLGNMKLLLISSASFPVNWTWAIGDVIEGSTFGSSRFDPASQTFAPLASDFLIYGKGRNYLVHKSSTAYYLYSGPTTAHTQIGVLGSCASGSFTISRIKYNSSTDAYGFDNVTIYISNATQSTPWYDITQVQTTGANLGYAVVTYERDNLPANASGSLSKDSVADIAIRDILGNAVVPSGDPYTPGGTTGPGGGTGTHDPTSSDPILFNVLPEVSAVGTGFLSLWSPTEQQMLDLSEYMWNANPLTLDFWRRLIADPIQLIYGLNIIPLSLYDAGLIGGTESVVVGMINTGIKMDYLTSQWVELDCGTIDIEETWGAYLDYDPYTKLDIYLPYIGYRPLRVDDFMPGSIHVKYKIDLLTGACCAQILSTKSDEHEDTLNSVIYQFTGNCATQIPVTATQYADAVRSAISLAAAIGTVALLAGAGAPAAGAAGAAIMPGVDPVGLLNPPGMVPVDSELFGTMSQYNFMTAASDTGAVLKSAGGTLKNVGMIHAGASAVENVMGIKPSVQRSGAIGGAAGMLGTQTPYLIFTRPRQAVPENQSKYTGYPSFMTRQLSELEGFTQIQSIHLEGIPCTANELAEIDALLKSGVIF